MLYGYWILEWKSSIITIAIVCRKEGVVIIAGCLTATSKRAVGTWRQAWCQLQWRWLFFLDLLNQTRAGL